MRVVRAVLAVLGVALAVAVFIFPALQLLSIGTWLLPAILGFFAPMLLPSRIAVEGRSYFSALLFVAGGAMLTGPWAIALARTAPSLPRPLQVLLASHTPSTSVDHQAYERGDFVPGEFAGIVALVSVGGIVLFFALLAMYAIGRSAMPRERRIWALRGAILVIVAGGTLLVHHLAPALTYLFGFLGYLTGIGFIVSTPDARDHFAPDTQPLAATKAAPPVSTPEPRAVTAATYVGPNLQPTASVEQLPDGRSTIRLGKNANIVDVLLSLFTVQALQLREDQRGIFSRWAGLPSAWGPSHNEAFSLALAAWFATEGPSRLPPELSSLVAEIRKVALPPLPRPLTPEIRQLFGSMFKFR